MDCIDCIEIKESRASEDLAKEALESLSSMHEFIGGRYFTRDKRTWTILAYFNDHGHRGSEWLPDGARVVEIPEHLLPWYGINVAYDDSDDAEEKQI